MLMAVSFRPSCAPRRAPVRRKPYHGQHRRSRLQVELLESRTVLSTPGSLDPKFGVGGLVTTGFGSVGLDTASAVLAQPDGKVVVIGTSRNSDFLTSEIALARYNRDGSLDTNFGAGGKVLTQIGVSDNAVAAVIRPDGRFIVEAQEQLNSPFSSQFENLLVQYNPDGSLDTNFGTAGFVETPCLTGSATAVALTPSGQIVVVSNEFGFVLSSFDMAKFNADGSLDTTFGNGGIRNVNFLFSSARDGNFGGFYINTIGQAVTVDSQGRILIAGQSAPDTIFFGFLPPVATLMRFNPDGSLDATFGVGGANTDVLGRLGFEATAVAVRQDGQIFVAGNAEGNTAFDVVVEQLNSDGSPNRKFGFDSITGTVVPSGATPFGNAYLALQSNGDLVVAVNTFTKPTPITFEQEMALVRYLPDGSLDQSFGTAGITTTFFPSISGIVGVAIAPFGDIFVAGSTLDPVTFSSQFALAAYLRGSGGLDGHAPVPATGPVPQPAQTAGGLNPAFGTGGIAVSPLGLFQTDLAVQPDGKIVAVGGDGQSIQVVRFNPDGSVDTSFGSSGVATTLIGGADQFESVVIRPDGKIVVSAVEIDAGTGLSNILLVQYMPDGSLDTGFGNGGSVITSLPEGQSITVNSFFFVGSPRLGLTLGPDGQIVVSGQATGGTGTGGLVVAEYNAGGSLNQGFGAGGITITPSFSDSSGNTFTNPAGASVAVDRHGRIVVSGTATNSTTFASTALLVRYNPDGSVDQSFGFQGAVTNVFNVPGTNDIVPIGLRANSLVVLPNDSIIVSGDGGLVEGFGIGFAVEAFNADGSPDERFGSHGITLYSPPPSYFALFNATGLAVQTNGDIIMVGTTDFFLSFGQIGNPGFTDTHFAMIRLTPDGNFDPSFGNNGVVTQTFPNPEDFVFPISVALTPNGDIVTGGTEVSTSFTFEFVLAEYLAATPDPAGPGAQAALIAQPTGTISADPAAVNKSSTSAAPSNQPPGSAAPSGASSHASAGGQIVALQKADRAALLAALSGGSAQSTAGNALDALDSKAIDALYAVLS
jgi:uncharacterized delta-60 repeat protein